MVAAVCVAVFSGNDLIEGQMGAIKETSTRALVAKTNDAELSAFWAFRTLMREFDARSLFRRNLNRLSMCFYQFDLCICSCLPRLRGHLLANKVSYFMFSTEWFVSLFSSVLPFNLLVRVWDLFLADGWRAILLTGIALLSYFEVHCTPRNCRHLLHNNHARHEQQRNTYTLVNMHVTWTPKTKNLKYGTNFYIQDDLLSLTGTDLLHTLHKLETSSRLCNPVQSCPKPDHMPVSSEQAGGSFMTEKAIENFMIKMRDFGQMISSSFVYNSELDFEWLRRRKGTEQAAKTTDKARSASEQLLDETDKPKSWSPASTLSSSLSQNPFMPWARKSQATSPAQDFPHLNPNNEPSSLSDDKKKSSTPITIPARADTTSFASLLSFSATPTRTVRDREEGRGSGHAR